MFNWIKNILGLTTTVENNNVNNVGVILPKEENVVSPNTLVLEDPVVAAPKTKKTKKTTKVENINLDSLSKTELLAEAKKRGIKANASLKKDKILERIKSA